MERIVQRLLLLMFLRAFFICYVSVVGLLIVIDAFANLDEFAKQADDVIELAKVMGRYYLFQQAVFLKYLWPILVVLAGTFTIIEAKRERTVLRRTRP